ncbi:hypothetical protein AMECASPLE_024014 [Ameca splendens]|uniref:Uncharacterized protein n=1 Tax=Ameca splendens TaxID=208324 RepID=A0ABV1ABZ3_9TELE
MDFTKTSLLKGISAFFSSFTLIPYKCFYCDSLDSRHHCHHKSSGSTRRTGEEFGLAERDSMDIGAPSGPRPHPFLSPFFSLELNPNTCGCMWEPWTHRP